MICKGCLVERTLVAGQADNRKRAATACSGRKCRYDLFDRTSQLLYTRITSSEYREREQLDQEQQARAPYYEDSVLYYTPDQPNASEYQAKGEHEQRKI